MADEYTDYDCWCCIEHDYGICEECREDLNDCGCWDD